MPRILKLILLSLILVSCGGEISKNSPSPDTIILPPRLTALAAITGIIAKADIYRAPVKEELVTSFPLIPNGDGTGFVGLSSPVPSGNYVLVLTFSLSESGLTLATVEKTFSKGEEEFNITIQKEDFVTSGSEIFDPDGDQCSNLEELEKGADPLVADVDEDEDGIGDVCDSEVVLDATLDVGPELIFPTIFYYRDVFLRWDEMVPAGKTLSFYEVCYVKDNKTAVEPKDNCPNDTAALNPYIALEALDQNSNYYFKVRRVYKNHPPSEWSDIVLLQVMDALVASYEFNDDVSGSAVEDVTGHGADGFLLNGAKFIAGGGVSGKQNSLDHAVSFDGANDFMKVDNSAPFNFGTGNFTLSLFVRTSTDVPGVGEMFVGKGTYSGGTYALYRQPDGKICLFTDSCGEVICGGILSINEWSFLTASREGVKVTLAKDGNIIGSGSCAENLTNGGLLSAGCLAPCTNPSDGLPAEAEVDRIHIHNVAVPLASIRNYKCATEERVGLGLSAYCLLSNHGL